MIPHRAKGRQDSRYSLGSGIGTGYIPLSRIQTITGGLGLGNACFDSAPTGRLSRIRHFKTQGQGAVIGHDLAAAGRAAIIPFTGLKQEHRTASPLKASPLDG